jgi:serine O-acetyltransferase
MKFLTDQFEEVPIESGRQPWLFADLRADMRAKAVWYYGAQRQGRLDCLRMLMSDGSLCTVLYRLMRALRRMRLGPAAAAVYKLNAFLTRAVIGRGAEFGPGLIILHSVGVIVNTAVRGGENVILEGGVTLGAEKKQSPTLGDNVFIGGGAKVIGGVRLGNGARIGANAVVVEDVPEGATAVGIPARVVRVRGGEHSDSPPRHQGTKDGESG